MACQLIYTSAPRSLEAGRSGFGTVARHRAISPLLVSAIERASQFSRLPGVDTGRVIYSYRIITIAGGRFHVLSSIRDAGADYTGRTNHIAHHLVAEPREIAQIGGGGPSPADVLQGMPWATHWTEPPRYLEAADEIPLAGFHAMTSGAAWERLTGSASHAWLLASAEGSRGAYIIRPDGVDLRPIFGESLRLLPERLWQISLTTSLQPSDEPADFRWIGIEAGSPLREQTATSGRPIYDLTEPATLPFMAAQSVGAGMGGTVGGVVGYGGGSVSLPAEPAPAVLDPAVSAAVMPAKARHGGGAAVPGGTVAGWHAGEKRKRGKLWLVVGIVGALSLVAGLYFQFLQPWYQNWQAEKEQRQAIKSIVYGSGYFMGARAIANPDADLEALHLADLEKLRRLAELTDSMLGARRAGDFPKMVETHEAYESYRQANPVSAGEILPKFNALADKVETETKFEEDLARTNVGPEGYDALEKLQQKAASIESVLGDYVPDGEKVKAGLDQLANEKQAGALMALLRGSSRPAQGVAWFESAVAKVKPAPDDAETRKVVETVNRILADWKYVDGHSANKSTAELESRLKDAAQLWPGWLRGLAEAKVKTARPTLTTGTRPAGNPNEAPLTRLPDDANTIPSALVLTFVSDEKSLPVALPVRGTGISYYLRVEGMSDEALQPFAGDVSRGLGPFGEYFKIVEGKLQAGAKPPRRPYAFVGKHDNADVFRIYVGAGRDDKPIFGVTDSGLKREGDELVVDVSKLPGTVAQALALRLPAGFGMKGSKMAVVELHGGRGDISAAVQELKGQLASISGGGSGAEGGGADTEVSAIRATVRKLSEKPKVKAENNNKKAAVDPPADAGLNRPGEMLAALFEKYWDAQTDNMKPNPGEEVRAELAKKSVEADWGALLNKLKGDFTYANSQFDGKSQYDRARDWVAQVEKLAERVCAYEYRKQQADKDALAVAARAAKAADEAKALGAHPLLNGKLPPGVYTLLVEDGERKLAVMDFKMP